MANSQYRWRKKYTLTILCWAAGSALAFYTNADLGPYAYFCRALPAMFGASDLVDKGKIKQLSNGQPE